jgi:hypothetical protein
MTKKTANKSKCANDVRQAEVSPGTATPKRKRPNPRFSIGWPSDATGAAPDPLDIGIAALEAAANYVTERTTRRRAAQIVRAMKAGGGGVEALLNEAVSRFTPDEQAWYRALDRRATRLFVGVRVAWVPEPADGGKER